LTAEWITEWADYIQLALTRGVRIEYCSVDIKRMVEEGGRVGAAYIESMCGSVRQEVEAVFGTFQRRLAGRAETAREQSGGKDIYFKHYATIFPHSFLGFISIPADPKRQGWALVAPYLLFRPRRDQRTKVTVPGYLLADTGDDSAYRCYADSFTAYFEYLERTAGSSSEILGMKE
jgi:hypothetical protein